MAYRKQRRGKNPFRGLALGKDLRPDSQVLALSLLTAGEQLHSFSSFMPSAFTANNWVIDGNPDQIQSKVGMWRKGYRPAVAIGMGLSAVVSVIARSPLPALFAGMASIAMIAMYEHVLPAEYRIKPLDWPGVVLLGQTGFPDAAPGAGDEPGPGLFKSRPGWEMENVLNVG
jgi:hypothetical protein